MNEEGEQAPQESLNSYKKVCSWDCDEVSNWMNGKLYKNCNGNLKA